MVRRKRSWCYFEHYLNFLHCLFGVAWVFWREMEMGDVDLYVYLETKQSIFMKMQSCQILTNTFLASTYLSIIIHTPDISTISIGTIYSWWSCSPAVVAIRQISWWLIWGGDLMLWWTVISCCCSWVMWRSIVTVRAACNTDVDRIVFPIANVCCCCAILIFWVATALYRFWWASVPPWRSSCTCSSSISGSSWNIHVCFVAFKLIFDVIGFCITLASRGGVGRCTALQYKMMDNEKTVLLKILKYSLRCNITQQIMRRYYFHLTFSNWWHLH